MLCSTAQPANAPAPAQRTTRRRATVEAANGDDDRPPHTSTAVPIPAQSTDAPAPAQPSRNSRYRATVEDADDDDDPPVAQGAANRSIHVTFDTTPRRRRHQEDPVNEGGPIEGKFYKLICTTSISRLITLISLLQTDLLFQTVQLSPHGPPPP